jgi:hypothetical protein
MKQSVAWKVFAAVGIAALSAAAYDNPLSNQSVREAYFLGQRRDDSTAKLLSQYVKRLPATNAPWQVAEIEVRTPYQQVVLRSRQSLPGYSAQQAWEEYRKRSAQIVVRIYLATAITQLIVHEDAWRQFKFKVEQGKEIRPAAITGWPVYLFADQGLPRIVGAEVYLELDAARVSSGPLRVEVKSPEGETSSLEFDLSRLR